MSEPMRSMLPPAAIESMFVRLLVTPEVFRESMNLITEEHFSPAGEAHLRALWRAMLRCYAAEGQLAYESMRDWVNVEVVSAGAQIGGGLLELLVGEDPPGVLYWAFRMGGQNPESQHPAVARELVRRFLTERMIVQPLVMGMNSLADRTSPQAIGDLIATAQRAQQRLQQVNINPVVSGMPTSWAQAALELTPTGLAYVDRPLDGGHAPGEVIGLLGPTGGGKTMLACNLVISCAEQELLRQHIQQINTANARAAGLRPEPEGPLRRVYFVSYEQGANELQHRLVSRAARIPFSTIKDLRDPDGQLSTVRRGNLQPYEIQMFRDMHPDAPPELQPLGEYERFMAADPVLRSVVRVIDLSGTSLESSRAGDGFVEEISALIEADQSYAGRPGVAVVVIDYALLAVQRYLATRSKTNANDLRTAIGSFVDQTRLQIAGRFRTPAWVLQQLNQKGNAKASSQANSHLDAAEGFQFSHACSFIFTLGTKHAQNSCVLFAPSKTRRTVTMAPTILQIGDMSMMTDVSDRYTVSPATRSIIESALSRQIGGAPVAPNSAVQATASAVASVY